MACALHTSLYRKKHTGDLDIRGPHEKYRVRGHHVLPQLWNQGQNEEHPLNRYNAWTCVGFRACTACILARSSLHWPVAFCVADHAWETCPGILLSTVHDSVQVAAHEDHGLKMPDDRAVCNRANRESDLKNADCHEVP
jgi:hypothetical protein